MPINTSIKTNPNAPSSQPAPRPTVSLNPQSTTTARANALKDRLRAPAQTTAPRFAGSSARAEQFSNQPKYPIPPPVAPQAQAAATLVTTPQKLSDVAPPPSGARPGVAPTPEPVRASPTNITEGTSTAPAHADATSELANPQLAVLARKERQIRKAQLDLKAQEDAFKLERTKYIPKDDITGPNALKNLSELGVTYDRLVEMQISQEVQDPNKPLLDKIAQLEERLAKVDQTFTERDSAQEQQVLTQIRRDAELLVDSDPTFETIKATDSIADVVDLIHKVFKAEGVVLSVEEAAASVEEKLVEREYARFQKLSQLQKIKARLTPPSPAAPEVTPEAQVEATPPQQQPQQATTLTNRGSATARPMTPRERVIARLKGEL